MIVAEKKPIEEVIEMVPEAGTTISALMVIGTRGVDEGATAQKCESACGIRSK